MWETPSRASQPDEPVHDCIVINDEDYSEESDDGKRPINPRRLEFSPHPAPSPAAYWPPGRPPKPTEPPASQTPTASVSRKRKSCGPGSLTPAPSSGPSKRRRILDLTPRSLSPGQSPMFRCQSPDSDDIARPRHPVKQENRQPAPLLDSRSAALFRRVAKSRARISSVLRIADSITQHLPHLPSAESRDELCVLRDAVDSSSRRLVQSPEAAYTKHEPQTPAADPKSPPVSEQDVTPLEDACSKLEAWIERQILAGRDYAQQRDQDAEAATAQSARERSEAAEEKKELKATANRLLHKHKAPSKRLQETTAEADQLRAEMASLRAEKDAVERRLTERLQSEIIETSQLREENKTLCWAKEASEQALSRKHALLEVADQALAGKQALLMGADLMTQRLRGANQTLRGEKEEAERSHNEELQRAVANVDQLKKDKLALRRDGEAAMAAKSLLGEKLKEAESQIKQLEEKAASSDSANAALQLTLNRTLSQTVRLNDEKQSLLSSKTELEESFIKNLHELSAGVDQAKSVIATIQLDRDERIQSLSGHLQEATARIDHLEAENASLQSARDELEQSLTERQTSEARQAETINALTAEGKETSKKLEMARAEKEALEREKQELRSKAESNVSRLTSELDASRAEEIHLALQLADAQQQLAHKLQEMDTAAQQAAKLQQDKATLEDHNRQLAIVASAARSRSLEISRLRMEQQRALAVLHRHPRFANANGDKEASLTDKIGLLLDEHERDKQMAMQWEKNCAKMERESEESDVQALKIPTIKTSDEAGDCGQDDATCSECGQVKEEKWSQLCDGLRGFLTKYKTERA